MTPLNYSMTADVH